MTLEHRSSTALAKLSTTSLKLDRGIKKRVQPLAAARPRSPHRVMREASEGYVEGEEKREPLRQDALAAWATYEAIGLPVTGEEADEWWRNWKQARKLLFGNATPEAERIRAARCRSSPLPAGSQKCRRCPACHKGHPRGMRIISRHPEIGRPVEDLAPEFREWLMEFGHGACIALYHYDGKQVGLLAVRHGR